MTCGRIAQHILSLCSMLETPHSVDGGDQPNMFLFPPTSMASVTYSTMPKPSRSMVTNSHFMQTFSAP